jgi:tol-pal system protein YbgF
MRFDFSVFAIGLICSLYMPSVRALAVVESRTGTPVVRSAANPAADRPASGERVTPLNYNQIEALKQEISELRGLVEVQEHEIKQLKKSQQDFYLDLDKRISQSQSQSQGAQNNKQTVSTTTTSKDIQITPKGKKSSSSITLDAKPITKPIENKIGVKIDPKPVTPKTEVKVDPKSDVKTEVKADSRPEARVEPKIEPKMPPQPEPIASTSSVATPNTAGTTNSNPINTNPNADAMVTNTTAVEDNNSNNAEKGAYESAYSLVRSKRYSDASVAFQDYLNRYPQGERSPSAHYWLGEIFMVQWQMDKNKTNLLDKASQAFLTITTQFPTHNKVPDALLKLGIIESERGNLEAAKGYFKEAKINHPGTAAARIAENRLQQLK